MKYKIIFLIILISNTLMAQIDFDEEVALVDNNYLTFTGIANSLCSADLDNNNYKDIIIVTGSSEGYVFWYENQDGNLFYRQKKTLLTIGYPSCVKVGDLNGDGLLDIIVTSKIEDTIVWYKNLDDGNFSDMINISTTIDGPINASIVDIDNDGDNDILIAVTNADSVVFFENYGNETFSNETLIYSVSSDTKEVRAKDLDNDGLLDIISGHSNGNLYWSKNLGNNNFDEPHFISGSVNFGTAFDFIDINNDGFDDIMIIGESDDKVALYLNQNGTTFSSSITIDNTNESPLELGVIDMDNDGFKDLIVSFSGVNDKIGWYKNLGNGVFDSFLEMITNVEFPKLFIIDDLNNDDFFDIISISNKQTSSSQAKLSYFENLNNISFKENVIVPNIRGVRTVKTVDIDGDGLLDIISGWFGGLLIIKNYGNNTYGSPKLISDPSELMNEIQFYHEIDIVDFDNDSDLDIVAISSLGVKNYTNIGNGNFVIGDNIEINNAKEIEINDLNGDGLKDIIINLPNVSERLFWAPNIDGVNFGDLIPISFTENDYRPNIISSGDIDNDGDIDLIVGSDNAKVQLLENDGNANFSYSQIAYPVFTDKIELIDIDNNGFLDVVTAGDYNGGSVINLIYNDGSFSSPILLESFYDFHDFTFNDLDNDGFTDLICMYEDNSGEDAKLYFYKNNSLGFQDREEIAMIDSFFTNSFSIGDLNNNDLSDIVIGHNKVLGYLNNRSTLSVVDVLNNKEDLTIFPVPFTNIIEWKELVSSHSYEVKIFDIMAKNILFRKVIGINQINLEFLNKGTYFIEIINSNGVHFIRKIIKD